jgi:hypothetical protein
VHGVVDPSGDIEIVNTELILADLETVDRRIERVEKLAKAGDKSLFRELDFCRSVQDSLRKGLMARSVDIPDEKSREILKEMHLLTAKKVLYVANVSESILREGGHYINDVNEVAIKDGSKMITICGDMEAEMAMLPEDDRKEFLEDLGLEESGLQKLIRAGYDMLGLITFYTTAGAEIKAWTIAVGTIASKAAGKIHTDMERGFIKAEVLNYKDFVKAGGTSEARGMGLTKIEGKEYVVLDGDIIYFRFNV